jgi:hypothetical protein
MSDLVYEGVVLAIENAPIGIRGAFLDWIVRTRVEKVLSGRFEGDAFAFRIHSPSRSGLTVGKRCTVTAVRTESGYTVDENQWRGCPHE